MRMRCGVGWRWSSRGIIGIADTIRPTREWAAGEVSAWEMACSNWEVTGATWKAAGSSWKVTGSSRKAAAVARLLPRVLLARLNTSHAILAIFLTQ